MKRTGFARKPTKPLKKCRIKKQSKVKISVVQRKLWELCKQIVRKKYGNSCYTCLRQGLVGSDWQTGHMWPKASLGAYLKYDLRLLRPQCFMCNIHRGGAGADFYARMLKEIGSEAMAQLENDRKVTVKALPHYLNLIAHYTEELNKLSK